MRIAAELGFKHSKAVSLLALMPENAKTFVAH